MRLIIHRSHSRLTVMFLGYALRTAGALTIFATGAQVDMSYSYGSNGIDIWTSELCRTRAGHARFNYFDRYFKARGLVNSTFGPDLPVFPYVEDAAPLVASIRKFITTFVSEYYLDDATLAADTEIQA